MPSAILGGKDGDTPRMDIVDMATLPDYLREGLEIVFIGINPSTISAREGHYFANPRNRFWDAFNRSGLVDVQFSPELDHTLPDYGIGFTDLVKRPRPQAHHLTVAQYRQGALALKVKLDTYQPLIACFHGLTAYGQYLKFADGVKGKSSLGLQVRSVGRSRVFVVPNPSPANARFSLEDLAGWYRQLKAVRDELRGG